MQRTTHVQQALAEWRAAWYRVDAREPHSSEWQDAVIDEEAAKDAYHAAFDAVLNDGLPPRRPRRERRAD